MGKSKMFIKKTVKHVDGITNVTAKGLINKIGEFSGEYEFDGMTYGITIPVEGCSIGDHDIVPILGFENSIVGEECRQCGQKFNI